MNIKKRTGKSMVEHLRAHVEAVAPVPRVLKMIGDDSIRNGTNLLSSREIERVIRSARKERQRPL